MKTSTIRVYCTLIALHLLLQQPCRASFFEMMLKRDAIYTPGKMNMAMKLADKATMQGKYSFRIGVFVDDTVVRKQTLRATKEAPTVFELHFPEIRDRTNVRCRAELLINSQFVEAQEKPLVLWPPLAPIGEQRKDKVIWVFDTSGALQRIFKDLQIRASDATFQAVRDFQVPDIIFIGEDVGLRSFQTLIDRILSKDESLEAAVFLQQKQFPEDWPIQLASAEKLSKNVSCDPNSPLLSGLSKLDIMNMTSDTIPVSITKPKDKKRTIDSHITLSGRDEKQIYSYLAVIKNEKLITIYCQLPVTRAFSEDPRSALVLGDLLQFIYEHSASTNSQ